MRYRLLASYQGAPYEAGIGPGASGVVLFAACPPPEDLHFEPATGHWRKTVLRADVQSLYESRPVGVFRGERCVVLDDLTDRLHIAYLGHDALKAEQLGYWEVDRGVFELIAPRQQVTEIVEQRLPISERGDAGGSGEPGYAGQAQNGLSGSRRGGGSDPGLSGPADSVSIPATDTAPLPLEAEAMRAAAEATRRGKEGHQDRDLAVRAPAGLSEPSTAVPTPGPGTSGVPSWMPPAPLSPERSSRPVRPETSLTESAPATEEAEAGTAVQESARTPDPDAGPTAPDHPAAADYSAAASTAARNGHHGGTAAHPLADAPPFDPYRQVKREPPATEAPASERSEAELPDTELPHAEPSGRELQPETVLTPSAAPSPVPSSSAPAVTTTLAPAPVSAAAATLATQAPPNASRAPGAAEPAGPDPRTAEVPAQSEPPGETRASRRRRSAKRRLPTQRIFSELADQAGIPSQAYAIGEDVDGAMCLVRTQDGFEVFNSLSGSRHEVRVFADEESAYFYLFGVLAAEAVRTGTLGSRA